MAEQDIKTRGYVSGDEAQIVELLSLVFDGWPRFDLEYSALDHWKWKYLDNPNKQNTTCVAEHNGTIVGVDHSIHTRIKLSDKIFLCTQGADTAIRPDHQGKRVYSRLNALKKELRKDHIGLSYWISGNPILVESAKRRKRPHFQDPFIDYIKVNDVDLHFKHREERALLKKGYLKAFKLRDVFTANNTFHDGDLVVSNVSSFDSRFTDFWHSIKDGFEFIVERTPEYLNWRYADPRGGAYVVKSVLEDDRVVGYIVLRINRYNEEYPEGYVAEFYSLPEKPIIRDVLMSEAMQFFNEHDVNIVHAFAFKSSKDAALLRKHGFVSSIKENFVFLNPLSFTGDVKELMNKHPDTISFNYGTSDFI